MYIYSITFSIKEALREEWLIWIQANYISRFMETGYFQDYSIKELLEPEPDRDMSTFNIQFSVESLATLNYFKNKFFFEIQSVHNTRYKDRVLSFETILKELNTW